METLTPAAEADNGDSRTSFGDYREPTILEVAQAEHFEAFDVEYEFLSTKKEIEASLHFGVWLTVIPYARKFVINIRRGAVQFEVDFALSVVERVRAGYMPQIPFKSYLSKQVLGETYYRILLGVRPSDPQRFSPAVVPCAEPDCLEFNRFHYLFDSDPDSIEHVAQILRYDGRESSYEVSAVSTVDDRAPLGSLERWHVLLGTGSTDFDITTAVQLAADLKEVTAKVLDLNTAARLAAVDTDK